MNIDYKNDTSNNKLVWNVFVEDFNSKSIVIRNIFEFNWVFRDGIIDLYREHKKSPLSFEEFFERFRRELMHEYWSRCEYEVVIVDFPPTISVNELDRLNKERAEYIEKWEREPYSISYRPKVGEKIDVYDQVMLNWHSFTHYVWDNLDLIANFKKVREKNENN